MLWMTDHLVTIGLLLDDLQMYNNVFLANTQFTIQCVTQHTVNTACNPCKEIIHTVWKEELGVLLLVDVSTKPFTEDKLLSLKKKKETINSCEQKDISTLESVLASNNMK